MKGFSESLSGRIGLVTLLGFSLRERYGVSNDTPFLPTDAYFDKRKKQLANIPYEDVWKIIHRGCMPELCENPDFDWQMFYGDYVRTYIERDVRGLSEIGDTVKFTRFMTAAAASTGQLINLASMARDVGISQPAAERWLSITVASNIVYLLKPYSNKPVIKANDSARSSLCAGGLVEQVKCNHILLLWIRMLFHFERIQCSVFFNHQIDLVHIFVAVEIQRRFNDSLVIITLNDLGDHEALKESTGHSVVFQNIRRIPPGKVGRQPGIQEIQLRSLHRTLGDVITLKGNDRVIPIYHL